jgi:DNA-directed RNA polymerase subunit RPC12/RpoP
MRPSLSACSSCKYYIYTLARSKDYPEPDPKFYKGWISDSEKSGFTMLALGFEKANHKLKSMFFLLDFWKGGIKDCFVDVDISKEEFDKRFSAMAERPAKNIDIKDARILIQRALFISNAVGTPIPWDYQRWRYMLGDMSTVPNPTGSLYKCARCGADLSAPIVETIKKHALSEDVHFYMVCGKCAGEFED